jgi:cytochrome c oxidase cbb3-type subunit 3
MSDFTSGFWSLYVGVLTIVSILGCLWLLMAMTTRRKKGEKVDTTGHVWDEDLKEWNNPLPNWWRGLFYLTVFFAFGYLVLYPGLGSFTGMLDWSSRGEYTAERDAVDKQVAPLYANYLQQDLKAVAADANARAMGQRLFLNYCAQCHGSDARGARGFPDLTDDDWLYGGDPETIKASIANGRNGAMPAMGPVIGAESTTNVVHYVRSLSGLPHDSLKASFGKDVFKTNCVACHGPEGKGTQAMGAPNLTDKVWLHGGTEAQVTETVTKGRNSNMPAHAELLGEGKVHLLAAYVWGLSHKEALLASTAPSAAGMQPVAATGTEPPANAASPAVQAASASTPAAGK